jgi:MFS family permease
LEGDAYAHGRRVIVLAGGVSAMGVLPVFMLGGLAVFMRDELGLSDSLLGVMVAVFFGASSLASLPGGRLAELRGPRAAVVTAAALSAVGLLGIPLLVQDALWLLPLVILSGAGNGVAQPTSNLLLARGVRPQRQGTAFGLKQASSAGATILVGSAVALLVAPLGWRGAFGVWALLAVVLPPMVPAGLRRRPPARAAGALRDGDVTLPTMIWLTTATGIGAAIGTAMASFFVPFTVQGGIAPELAGALLTFASVGTMFARALLGVIADRMVGGHLRLAGRCVVAGAVGFAGFALLPVADGITGLLVGATALVFLAGWSWHGVFNYAIARANPNAPGAAAAIIGVGVFLGGVIGPLGFGFLADQVSYRAAWMSVVIASVVCYACMLVGARLVQRERQLQVPA